MLYFIQKVQHNVRVTHYGIRRLHSNTLRVCFPSLDILLGRVLLGRAACLSRHSEELMRQKGERTDWDPHTQSLTLIINYGCFCFFLPQPLTAQLLAVRDRENGRGGERERARKGQFSSKRIIYQNKWDECALEPCQSGPPLKALWTDEDLYVFNRKRVSSKG